MMEVDEGVREGVREVPTRAVARFSHWASRSGAVEDTGGRFDGTFVEAVDARVRR